MDEVQEDKLKELAETLRKHGLAVSMYEAMEKAKSILSAGVSENKDEDKQDVERFSQPDYEVTKEKVSLSQLMEEIGVKEEEVEVKENERLSQTLEEIKKIKEEIEQSKSDPEKMNQIRQELLKLNEEVSKLIREMDYKKEG